jgi:dynein heavy chain
MIEDDLPLRDAIAEMFPRVHRGAQDLALKFYEEQRRRVYITPKAYLDGLNLFKEQLSSKRHALEGSLARLQSGIWKLEATNTQIAELQVTLTDLVPKLQEENKSAELQAAQIQEQTVLAQQREQETEREARVVMQEAKQIEQLRDEADFQVAKAKPALLAAEKAVKELSKDDIAELKKVAAPTEAARAALACTLVLLGSKNTDWKTAQKALADIKFLDRLRSFDRDNIPEKVLEKVRALTRSADFAPERMLRASKAAAGLAKWCKAIREYGEAILIVRPLQEKQAQMRAELQDAQEAVAVKQAAVAAITARLAQLEDDYRSTLGYIQALQDDKAKCEKRLSNAS